MKTLQRHILFLAALALSLSLTSCRHQTAPEPATPSESSENPSDSGNNGGNSNVILYAGIGAVAVLALLGAVFVMRRRA